MKIQLREVNRLSGRIAFIKSASARKMMVPSNSTVRIDGKLDRRMTSGAGFDLTPTWNESTISSGFSIMPTLIDVQSHGLISVELSNLSSSQ